MYGTVIQYGDVYLMIQRPIADLTV